MIAAALLLIVLALAWFMLAGFRVGGLTVYERIYLFLSPLPVVMALGIPLAMTALGSGRGQRSWSNRLTEGGIWLSAALVVSGLVLLWPRWVRNDGREGRLAAGIFLAGIPVFLTLAVISIYWLRG